MNWFALKVFYNKVFALRDELAPLGIESYIPVKTVVSERPDGSRRKTVCPLVNSLMFVRTSPERALGLQPLVEGRAMVYTRREATGRVPVPIPDREMNIFMLVTSGGHDGVEYIGDDCPEYHRGDRVRVTDGPFEGCVGHVVRIRDNKRLVVSIQGLCAVATSYIPRAFLEKIDL